MQNEQKAMRAIRSSFWATILVTTWLYAVGKHALGWGFLIGAIVSLFSIATLGVVVPMFFRPGASGHARFILGLTFFMKLPVFALALYLGTHLKAVNPLGLIFGIAVAPAVITLQALGSLITTSRPEAEEGAVAPETSASRRPVAIAKRKPAREGA
jgi:hypothetical protein